MYLFSKICVIFVRNRHAKYDEQRDKQDRRGGRCAGDRALLHGRRDDGLPAASLSPAGDAGASRRPVPGRGDHAAGDHRSEPVVLPRTAENLPGHPVRIRPKQLLAPAVRPGREVHPTDRTDRARPRRVSSRTRFSDRPRRANRLAAQSHRGDHHLRIRRRFHPAGTTARTSRQLPALRAARCEEPRHLVVRTSRPGGRRPDLDPRGFRAAKPLFPRVGRLVVA